MSFAALKKQSKAAIDKIGKKFEEEKSGGRQNDETFWSFQVDKAGKGQATIRFLPAPEGEEMPYVKRFEYFVKHNGKYYVENCRTTIGEKDPMNEHFFEIRGDGSSESKKLAANTFKRSTHYIANVYIVDDPAAPENNGKVLKYKFGTRIFNKLEQAIKPEFDDESPFNPFDLWEGANLKLKASLVDGQRNYNSSKFEPCGPLHEDDDKLEEIWKSEYSLQVEIAPDKFKSYDVLAKKLEYLLEAPGEKGSSKSKQSSDSVEDEEEKPPVKPRSESVGSRKSEEKAKPQTSNDEDEDDDMSKFRSLLGDD